MANEQTFGQWVWCGNNDAEYRYGIQKLDAFNERNIVYDLLDAIESKFGITILQWQLSYQADGNYLAVTKYCDAGEEDEVVLTRSELVAKIYCLIEEMTDEEKDFVEVHLDELLDELERLQTTANDLPDYLQNELEKYDEYLAMGDDDDEN